MYSSFWDRQPVQCVTWFLLLHVFFSVGSMSLTKHKLWNYEMEVVDCLVILTAQTLLNSVCTPFFFLRDSYVCNISHHVHPTHTSLGTIFSACTAVFSLFPAFFTQPYKELGIKEMKIAAMSGKVQHRAWDIEWHWLSAVCSQSVQWSPSDSSSTLWVTTIRNPISDS